MYKRGREKRREREREEAEEGGGREITWAVQHSQYDTSTLQYWSPHLLYPSLCAAVIGVLLRISALQ